MKAYLQ